MITREIAEKVRDVVDAGLVNGVGKAVPGQMCVEAAVCFALGLPHGDDPGCVAQTLRRLKIRLNDSSWPSKEARAAGLRRLAVAQLGSAGALDDREFVRRVVDMTIRRALPEGLRAAARVNPKHADALEASAVRCETEGTRESAREGERVARAAAASAVSSADYASASAYAASSAAAAAASADYAAASAAASADYAARARDRALAEYAEWVVEILIDMNAPGCQWLDLVPRAA